MKEKNETLLMRANSNYKTAILNFKYSEEDEFQLNVTGYFIEQTIELLLKHYLEINAIKYNPTHNIRELIEMVVENNIKLIITDRLNEIADVLTTWESKTRYIKNFFLYKKSIDLTFKVIDEFIQINNIKFTVAIDKLNNEQLTIIKTSNFIKE